MLSSIRDILSKQCSEKESILAKQIEDKDYVSVMMGSAKIMAAGLYGLKKKEKKEKSQKARKFITDDNNMLTYIWMLIITLWLLVNLSMATAVVSF